MKRRVFAVISLLSLFVISDAAIAKKPTVSKASSVKVIRGPYLQMATPNSIVVRWRTNIATDSQVDFSTNKRTFTQSVRSSAITSEHEVKLTGLTPETRYWYAVGATNSPQLAGGDTETFFSTGANLGTAKPTRIWVTGDIGSGTPNQVDAYNAYINYTGSTYTDLWLLLGDNAYTSGSDFDYQTNLFSVYPTLFKQTPVWPTLGNHDAMSADSSTQSGPYYDIFNLPKHGESGGTASGTEAYYSFEYSNIHFVVLDSQESDRSTTGAMANWLKQDLKNQRADWLIAFWHHPPYSKGAYNSDTDKQLTDVRENFLPILEDYGVDLVLNGHNHTYARSFFIDGHYGKSDTFDTNKHVVQRGNGHIDGSGMYRKLPNQIAHNGTVYAIVGSAGKVVNTVSDHPAMFTSLNELGSMILDIDGARLNAKFLNAKGIVRDYFTIAKDTTSPISSQSIEFQNGLNGYNGVVDSSIASNQPNNNFGNSQGLTIDGNEGVYGRLSSLMQWNQLTIPMTAIVDSAVLTLTVSNTSTGTFNVYALNTSWSENTASWNTINPLNNLGALIGTTSPGVASTQQVKLNAEGIALVQDWVSGTAANNGLIILDATTNDAIQLRSSEYTTVEQRPKLTITYH